MSLSSAKPALKTALLAIANNADDEKTVDEGIDEFLNQLETWISSATITVPATGLVAPNGGGPVTGSANGTLS